MKLTMLALSKTSGYAIFALSCMNGPDGPWILVKNLAACTGVPPDYLSAILHALARCGLIKAKRGYRGGFVLARLAEEISVLQVVEAVEGRVWSQRCLLGLSECSDQRACPTHDFWKTEQVKIKKLLSSLSLAEVGAFERSDRGSLRCGASQDHDRATPRRKKRQTRRS